MRRVRSSNACMMSRQRKATASSRSPGNRCRRTTANYDRRTNRSRGGWFCIFIDPPKVGAGAAVARLAAQGVRVKVVSGDHEKVVRHVVETLKMPARGMLTGAEIAALTDSALAARVQDVDIFARVTPDQKTRIIRALQVRGHTVGFLGDGVNDAPAIRAAEVGLSVEGATDVARSAADMILLAQDLGVISDGVEEGRRTLANIMKYVRMGTSSNFGNMLSMALALAGAAIPPIAAGANIAEQPSLRSLRNRHSSE